MKIVYQEMTYVIPDFQMDNIGLNKWEFITSSYG